MPADTLTTLLLGDVYSDPGCRVIFYKLKSLIKKYKADFVVLNGENAHNGFGLSDENIEVFLSNGADVITSGNHIWQNEDVYPTLDRMPNVLRPANVSQSAPGHGSCVVNGIGVINLQGRIDMKPIDDPFKVANDIISQMKGKTDAIFVDFHAENAEEKEALAYYLDGEVTAVVGTHTHIQTADERILPKGTAYITDLGMTGPQYSVIGCDAELSFARNKTQLPIKAKAAEGECRICGVVVVSDRKTRKALSITRISE